MMEVAVQWQQATRCPTCRLKNGDIPIFKNGDIPDLAAERAKGDMPQSGMSWDDAFAAARRVPFC
jgi:hypothetical protein